MIRLSTPTPSTPAPVFPAAWRWVLAAMFLAAMSLATTLATAPMARAHGFNVTVLVPAGTAAEAQNALLLASGERDRHDAEESDGHLGGLDVYFTLISETYLVLPLRPIVMESEPDIIVILAGALRGRGFQGMLDDAGPAILKLAAISPEAARRFLSGGSPPGLEAFAPRYRALYQRAPGPVATLAYIAARRIDAAVRQLGGVGDRAALASLLGGG